MVGIITMVIVYLLDFVLALVPAFSIPDVDSASKGFFVTAGHAIYWATGGNTLIFSWFSILISLIIFGGIMKIIGLFHYYRKLVK